MKKIIASFMAVILGLIVLFVLLNISDEELKPEVAQFLDQKPSEVTEAELQNFKYHLGFRAGKEGDPLLTGEQKYKLLNENRTDKELSKKIRDERHGPTSWVSITLTEGKFRQVRKMTAAVGYPTLRLIRVRTGKISILDLDLKNPIEVESIDF